MPLQRSIATLAAGAMVIGGWTYRAAGQCNDYVPGTDTPCGAMELAGFGTDERVMDVTPALPDPYVPDCGVNVGHAVWFKVTPVFSGPVTFTTCHPATTFDTVLQVYQSSGDCEFPIRLDELCNDDTLTPDCQNGCSGRGSVVTFDASAGFTYFFQVGSYSNNGAGCDLCLGVSITLCNNDLTPPFVELSAPGPLACICDQAAIIGSAFEPDGSLASYELEARPAGFGGWTTLAIGTDEIVDDVLTYWNTSGLSEGYHILRLKARNVCDVEASALQVVWLDKEFQALTINSPAANAIVGGNVCIDGVVWDTCFDHYTAEYRSLESGNFNPVDPMSTTYPDTMINLVCAEWDTTGLNGPYELRLRGFTECAVAETLLRGVTVDNIAPVAEISSPAACSQVGLPGDDVMITGTVHDSHLEGWVVQFTGGPVGGWETIGSGASPVMGGTLAVWETYGLPPCAYTLRIVAADAAVINCNPAVSNRTEHTVSVNLGCPGDTNRDGEVNVDDLVGLLLEWGECTSEQAARQLREIIEALSDQESTKAVRR